MVSRLAPIEVTQTIGYQWLLDVVSLTKPRVMAMIVAVTGSGFYLGTAGTLDAGRLFHVLFGTAWAAGGALALNQYLERDADALMLRTLSRPLPAGRLQPYFARRIGLLMTLAGISYLALFAHPLAGLTTTATVLTYLLWYTPAKRKTALSTVIGAIPGALPPVTGWVAACGRLDLGACVLFGILFLWQLPHALAIACLYRDDYERAGFRLLPVIHPQGQSTGRQIVSNCLALLGVALMPTLIGMTGTFYFTAMLMVGLVFLGFGIDAAHSKTMMAARRLVLASLLYVPITFILMAVDKTPRL